jgi:hypothetical protein
LIAGTLALLQFLCAVSGSQRARTLRPIVHITILRCACRPGFDLLCCAQRTASREKQVLRLRVGLPQNRRRRSKDADAPLRMTVFESAINGTTESRALTPSRFGILR